MALTVMAGASARARAARQHDDAGFGDAVSRVGGPGQQAAERGKIDDAPATAPGEQGCGALGGEELRFQIRVQDRVPLGFRGLTNRGGRKDRGVVYENVQAGEGLLDPVEQAIDFGDAR